MNKRTIVSALAVLSTIVVLLIAGSTQLAEIVNGQQPASTGTQSSGLVMQGLQGLRGFGSGHSQLTMAVIPLSQQNSQMAFQLVGFAVSIPETGEAVVYSLQTPLPGIIDPSQNTLQIDISDLDTAIDIAGYTDSSQIYDVVRSDPRIVIIDLDLSYQSTMGSQTIFNVNGLDMIPPDGRMEAFSMQKPTQLIIDTQNKVVSTVAFPEMANTFGNYYTQTYAEVQPVVYAQPVPVMAPIFVPYVQPIPFYYTGGFIHYSPFVYGAGFRTFYDWDRIHNLDRISNNYNRFPINDHRNNFADNSRRDLIAGQQRGEFAQSRSLGANVNGGIGGYRGGSKVSTGMRTGGMRGGRAGGGRR